MLLRPSRSGEAFTLYEKSPEVASRCREKHFLSRGIFPLQHRPVPSLQISACSDEACAFNNLPDVTFFQDDHGSKTTKVLREVQAPSKPEALSVRHHIVNL